MFRSVALSAGATALLLVTPVFAHHPSGAGSTGDTGPIVTIPATTLEKGHSSAAVVFEYIKLDPLTDAQLGGHPHPHSLDAILSTSLIYAYGVTDDLTLSLRLPFVRRTNIRDGHGASKADGNGPGPIGDSAGVGDLSVLAQYRFFKDRASQAEVALLAGLTLPTGDTSVNNADPDGVSRFEGEFQPGGGAWSGSVGLAFSRRFGAWSLDSNVLYQFTGDSKQFGHGGLENINLGDRFLYNAAVSYRITSFASHSGRMNAGLPEPMYHGGPKARHHHNHHEESRSPSGPALDLVLELNGEWHDRQTGEHGVHSGGNTIYLSPGVRLSADKWSGFVSVGVPVVNDLNGIQPEPEWRVLSGVSLNF